MSKVYENSLYFIQRMHIPYEDKRILAYLIGGLATIFGTVIYAMVAAHKFGALGDAGCLSLSYVYNLEFPLLTVLLMVFYVTACAFFWGIVKERSQYILPFFCLLVATVGFIGHAHVERMLFEVSEDERRFIIVAFVFTTAVLVFASAITLMLYREMNNLRRYKTEFNELFAPEEKY
ncbi:AAEL006570-PA [Aedes aegypti]|uniref:AAEL006570-PA n=1 Tax=Aedes aegypti TaxID=7159 RepID=Q175T2_AEDAE|nr:AAEL006570-PA [Aedes aegypti]